MLVSSVDRLPAALGPVCVAVVHLVGDVHCSVVVLVTALDSLLGREKGKKLEHFFLLCKHKNANMTYITSIKSTLSLTLSLICTVQLRSPPMEGSDAVRTPDKSFRIS